MVDQHGLVKETKQDYITFSFDKHVPFTFKTTGFVQEQRLHSTLLFLFTLCN